MEDVADTIRRPLAELKARSQVNSTMEPKSSKDSLMPRKKVLRAAEPSKAPKKEVGSAAQGDVAHKAEVQQRLLLDAHMANHQAHEEACLRMLHTEEPFERPVTLSYDEAAGPASPLRILPFKQRCGTFTMLWSWLKEAVTYYALSPVVGFQAQVSFHASHK